MYCSYQGASIKEPAEMLPFKIIFILRFMCFVIFPFLKKGKKRGEKSLSLVTLKLAMPRIDTVIVFFPIYLAQM